METTNLALHNKLTKYSPEDIEKSREYIRKNNHTGLCKYDCPKCKGSGYLRVGDGTVELCPNIDRSSLPSASKCGITQEETKTLKWDDIKPVNNTDVAIKALKTIFKAGYGWLYLHGSYGLGKSLILKTAVAICLRENRDGAYVRMAEIFDDLRQGFNDKSEDENKRLEFWSEIPLLAIDEFERIRNTEYNQEKRFVLMDRRYELAEHKEGITLIASNCDPRVLPGYLSDRIYNGRFYIVELSGKSVRPGLD